MEDGAWAQYALAEIEARVGETDRALDRLGTVIPIPHLRFSRCKLRLDPGWDPLRGHPRFERLIEGKLDPPDVVNRLSAWLNRSSPASPTQ